MTRPADSNRHAAAKAGARTYQGNTCRRGHDGKRYTSTGACIACMRQGYRASRALSEFGL